MEPDRSNLFALSPGSRIGKYEVLRKLAIGGMAEIYLVRVTGAAGFEKLMVLKRILPSVAADPRFIEMFLDEARLAATLRHPNIADVLDVGESDGSYFFTMEYVHGQDVRTIRNAARERNEIVPLPFVLAIVVGVATALHHAHTKLGNDGKPLGLVHRDVSASNVMVSYEGAVKLLDFGIARAKSSTHTTQTGALKGKAPYMSPEQCRMRPLDRRSDLFSLGVIMYELTVGRRPFRGVTQFEIMEQIVNSVAQRPSELVHGYPPDLEAMVMKLLAPVPDNRYATGEELLYDLEAFIATHAQWQSSRAISRYMRELFVDKIEAWERAQEAGVPFADHVARTITSQSLTSDSMSMTPMPELSSGPATTPEARRISEPIPAFTPLRPVRRSTPVPVVPPPEARPFGASNSTIEARLLAESEPLLPDAAELGELASTTTAQSIAAGAEPTIQSTPPPAIAATVSTTTPERTIEISPPPPFKAHTLEVIDAPAPPDASNVPAPEVTVSYESELPAPRAEQPATSTAAAAQERPSSPGLLSRLLGRARRDPPSESIAEDRAVEQQSNASDHIVEASPSPPTASSEPPPSPATSSSHPIDVVDVVDQLIADEPIEAPSAIETTPDRSEHSAPRAAPPPPPPLETIASRVAPPPPPPIETIASRVAPPPPPPIETIASRVAPPPIEAIATRVAPPPPPIETTAPPPIEITAPPRIETTAPPPIETTAPPPIETTAPPPIETPAPADDETPSVLWGDSPPSLSSLDVEPIRDEVETPIEPPAPEEPEHEVEDDRPDVRYDNISHPPAPRSSFGSVIFSLFLLLLLAAAGVAAFKWLQADVERQREGSGAGSANSP